MYTINKKNSSYWLVIAFIEYFLYMIVFSLFFQINKEILIYILIISSLFLYKEYSLFKANHRYFESISKKIFIIVHPVYLRIFIERVVILICIVVLIRVLDSDIKLINDFLQCLFLLVAFNYKHVYVLKPKDSMLEEVRQLVKDKKIGKIQLHFDEYKLHVTNKDLRYLKRLLDGKIDN